MKKPLIQILCLAVLILLDANSGLSAQAESTGRLGASILAEDARRLADVSVLIENKDRQWTTRSDQRGQFKVELPIGTYRFTLEKDGFKKFLITDVIVKPATEVSYRLTMEVGGGSDWYWHFEPDLGPPDPVTTSSQPGGALTLKLLPQSAPNISVNGYAATDKVQRGHLVQVAVVMDIPGGYHVNSNRPLESFLKATQLKVETPSGARAGPVTYPRAVLRKFSFSNDKLSVYEGRVVLRFSVTVPASFRGGSLDLKAKLNYQSCSDALCFPPQSREVNVQVPV